MKAAGTFWNGKVSHYDPRTPWKIDMLNLKITQFEKEHRLNQTFMTLGFKMLKIPGCKGYITGKVSQDIQAVTR